MKREAIKAVSYPDKLRRKVVNAIIYCSKSIAETCFHYGISDTRQVHKWLCDYRKERGITVMPKKIQWKHKYFHLELPDAVNKEIQRLEEINIYLQSLVEAMFQVGDEETKKKLLAMLSPSQRRNLQRKGKL